MYCISKELFVWIMAFITIDWIVNKTMFVILTKYTIPQFFKNLFTKGKKKKLTEPEPVTEAPISSTPPHKRTRKRPPKRKRPPRPKIELHPLCFIEKALGWISAKAKLVAPKAWKLFVGLLRVIGKVILWLLKALLKILAVFFTRKGFRQFCDIISSPLDKIDPDKAFAIGGAVLGVATYATLATHSGALSD